jgi:DNA-binding MarR family transcriptional regulator
MAQEHVALRVLARLHRVLEATDSGLTVPQYRMLTALSEGGERSARLAERLTIRKPTVTALADGLIAAGYAQRHSEPGDRRIVRLHITDAGRRALEEAERAYVERLGPLLDAVPDRDQFVAGLTAIGAAMDRRAAAKHAAAAETAVTETAVTGTQGARA